MPAALAANLSRPGQSRNPSGQSAEYGAGNVMLIDGIEDTHGSMRIRRARVPCRALASMRIIHRNGAI